MYFPCGGTDALGKNVETGTKSWKQQSHVNYISSYPLNIHEHGLIFINLAQIKLPWMTSSGLLAKQFLHIKHTKHFPKCDVIYLKRCFQNDQVTETLRITLQL